MTELDLGRSLALTLRHTFGDVLDLPLLESGKVSSGADPAAALQDYAVKIRFCDSCSLHIGRAKLVFGRGHWDSRIAFLGDYPSSKDDAAGDPFSDEHGDLLHKMIIAMKLRPEDVYLTNLYKCRPPAHTRFEAQHFEACQTHLKAQFAQVRAPLIVAMGEETAKRLARSEAPLQVLRKQIFEWQGRKVICTHHPRDLHQSPQLKKEAWEDLQIAMRELEKC